MAPKHLDLDLELVAALLRVGEALQGRGRLGVVVLDETKKELLREEVSSAEREAVVRETQQEERGKRYHEVNENDWMTMG